MRIHPISNNYQTHCKSRAKKHSEVPETPKSDVAFNGKHDCALALGGAFATLGAIGAVGGTLIMTGGLALPVIAGYSAVCGSSGAMLGHYMDRGIAKDEEKAKKKEQNK